MFPDDLVRDATAFLERMRQKQRMLVTAESCTGGLLAGLLTEIAGSSDVVERGLVTYSNRAKSELLGVDPLVIEKLGAVSAEVAEAMARGALLHTPAAHLSISVTGVAGPGGGSPNKPVGLVYLGACYRNGAYADAVCRFGDIGRTNVRVATLRAAIQLAGAVIP